MDQKDNQMRIEPENGQDIAVHCGQARIMISDQEFHITDMGSYIEIRQAYQGGTAPGMIVQPLAGNVVRIQAGRMK
jgi:hypothetical protein